MSVSWNELRQLLDVDLPSADRMVLVALRIRSGDNGRCWPSQDRLARDCGLTERSIRTITSRLEARGFISVGKHTSDGRLKEYAVNTGNGFRQLPEPASANYRKWVPKYRKPATQLAEAPAAEGNKKDEKKGERVAEPDGPRSPDDEPATAEQMAELRRDLDRAVSERTVSRW
jgi:hypothetical protein